MPSNGGNAATPDSVGNEFTDVLPFGVTLTSASATSGTAVANIGTNTVTWGSIAANGSVTITINTVISSAALGNLVSNQGRFAFDADLNGSNESTGVTDDPTVTGSANAMAFAGPRFLYIFFTMLRLFLRPAEGYSRNQAKSMRIGITDRRIKRQLRCPNSGVLPAA